MSSSENSINETEKKYEYVFHGRVYPERTNVHVGTIPLGSEDIEMYIQVMSSLIFVRVFTTGPIKNILTLRNTVDQNVRRIIDTFAFIAGYGYEIEISSVTLPGGKIHVFGVGVGVLQERLDSDEQSEYLAKIINLNRDGSGEYLRRALRDLRMAMRYSEDRGVFLYRAHEAVRKYFEDEFFEGELIDGERSQAWETMREELGIDRSHFYPLEESSKEQRHGGRVQVTDEDSADLFERTWEMIKKFIDYRSERFYSGLDLDVDVDIT